MRLIMMLYRRQLEHLVSQFVLGRHRPEDVALDKAVTVAIDADDLELARLQFLIIGTLEAHAHVL